MDTNIFLTDGMAGLFAIGIISAVIIAYGVHFLISTFSLATGLTLTPDLKEKAAKAKARSLSKTDKAHEADNDEDDDEHESMSMMTVTSALGAWALLTASIALFVGSYFGVVLVPVTPQYAVVAGLVIWALYFLSVLLLEYKAVSTVVGGLVHSAITGIRGSASAASSMLSPSGSMEDHARKSVRAVYDEVDKMIRKDNIDKKLGDYLHQLVPHFPTMHDIDKELKHIIRSIEAEHRVKVSGDDIVEVIDLHFNDHPTVNAENIGKLKRAASNLKHKVDQADGKGAAAAFDSLAPVSDEKAAQLRKKLAGILEKTSNPDISVDHFRDDIVKMFDDPMEGADSLRARLALFDRTTIKELVAEASGLDSEKSEKIVDQVFDIFTRMKGAADETRVSVNDRPDVRSAVSTKLEEYLNGLNRPELNYLSLKRDVQSIMEEPGSAPTLIRDRLHKMDKESVIALLSSNSRISEDQARKAADTVMEARDRALETYTAIETEMSRRYQQSRRKMVIYSEHIRKNSIAAAWWLVASAVVSAAASVGGALLSI